MTEVWGAVGAGLIGIVALLVWARRRAKATHIDHGSVSDSWLAEQKMASRDRL